jgi:ABC-type arginine transport system permease subunit
MGHTPLEYGRQTPNRIYYGVLSSAIGALTCILSILVLRLILSYGGGPVIESTRNIVVRFGQDDQLMPLVSGVAALGIGLGAYGRRRGGSALSFIGMVASIWGFVVSLGVSALFFVLSGMSHAR